MTSSMTLFCGIWNRTVPTPISRQIFREVLKDSLNSLEFHKLLC